MFSEDSSRLAERIYFRAGAYLMAGAVIAFSGLGIFAYIRATTLHPNESPVAAANPNEPTTQAHPGQIPAFGQQVTPSPPMGTGRVSQPPAGAASPDEPTTQAHPEITQAHEGITDRIFDLIPGIGILFFIEFVALFFLRQYRAAMDDFRYYDAVRRHREESLVILNMFAENDTVMPTADVLKNMSIYSSAGKLGKDETTEILETRKLQRDEMVFLKKWSKH
jgi:hypothetical protein